jgi:hypothetical protein
MDGMLGPSSSDFTMEDTRYPLFRTLVSPRGQSKRLWKNC